MFKLILRSLRRNRRRTLLTAAAIALAALLVFFFRCLQESTYDHMVAGITHLWIGSARIAPPDALEEPSLSLAFHADPDRLRPAIPYPLAPRIEGYALISWKDRTMGAAVVGIDPHRDPATLRDRVVTGRWIRNRGEIVMGKDLAEVLGLRIGDRVAVITQGRDGSLGAALFTAVGWFQTGLPVLNRSLSVIHIDDADSLYAMDGTVSYIAVFLPDPMHFRPPAGLVRRLEGRGLHWFDWRDLAPELHQAIELDRASGYVYYLVIIAVVGFGLLNTVYMSIYERRKEIAVLRAIGLSRPRLMLWIAGEGILIAVAGFVAGIVLSLPLFAAYYHRPIVLSGKLAEAIQAWGFEPAMYLDFRPEILITLSVWLIVSAVVIALIPGFRVTRMPLPEILKFEK